MLKFLTHKLRTHSLNEENVSEKVEERDSGTESDDEAERADSGEYCADVIMKWNDVTDISTSGEACACAPAPPRPLAAPEPDQLYDHHSSEEELEHWTGNQRRASRRRGGEGRRETTGRLLSGADGARKTALARGALRRATGAHPVGRRRRHKGGDSRTFPDLPPLEALKPRRSVSGAADACGCSPRAAARPPSPRRRRMPPPPPRRHRPALDFDKMQQLKVGGGGVRSWRAVGGAHGGELSVFCW